MEDCPDIRLYTCRSMKPGHGLLLVGRMVRALGCCLSGLQCHLLVETLQLPMRRWNVCPGISPLEDLCSFTIAGTLQPERTHSTSS
jgi:hypothetical protein